MFTGYDLGPLAWIAALTYWLTWIWVVRG